MKEERMKKASSDILSERQKSELEALVSLPDDRIDTQDVPEVRDWTGAKRGLFYRPNKQQITLRIDADVLAWFKARAAQGKGYQSDINLALREYVQRQVRGAR
ncbi:MAG: BrnA antitoxin family protein [Rhodomicrobium sp.]